MIHLKAEDLIASELEANFHFHHKLKYWTIVHNHDFYEIFMITEGTVTHIVNDIRQTLFKGDLILIRPEDVHSYERYEDQDVALLNINFHSNAISSAFRYLGEDFFAERLQRIGSLPPQVRLSVEQIQYIWRKYEQIAAIPMECAAEACSVIRGLLIYLLNEHFFPAAIPAAKPGMPEWLSILQLEMQKKENFSEGIPALYRLANKTPEHLSRTILKHLGKTPTIWINELRLQYSVHLLKHSTIDIVTIALDCGFNSLSHYYKSFQMTYYTTPGKFRSANQKLAIPQ
ncbi:helix-turn-helix domain-containing protein [Paenibacillus psychroresistens]|uniref:Helix-turn-helix domain-containing protein n=1 Tax=Paenibacillus psychroresistens TaxID=1778678 RepID=A0A6B8RG84_9BACL|nr:helix-turn-helix domain-containing protein [Paenibacillus psychroresistens]QGQ95119.1 helix-turn-helix domain-containing protein [Paenibacillus psychroresistens]